ncbi:MAG: VanZ family protein [Gammaproteobacteria bacterium]|nr:VanZ family protein [Gammaproteobacteria bacterium]
MNTSIKLIGFTVVLSFSVVATVKPDVLSFVRMVPYGDKIAHFVLFGLLGMLCGLQTWRIELIRIWPGIILTTGIAIADELLQLVFASRTFSFVDLLANLLGILVFTTATNCYCLHQRNLVHGRSKQ